jgi:hypothetical protein
VRAEQSDAHTCNRLGRASSDRPSVACLRPPRVLAGAHVVATCSPRRKRLAHLAEHGLDPGAAPAGQAEPRPRPGRLVQAAGPRLSGPDQRCAAHLRRGARADRTQVAAWRSCSAQAFLRGGCALPGRREACEASQSPGSARLSARAGGRRSRGRDDQDALRRARPRAGGPGGPVEIGLFPTAEPDPNAPKPIVPTLGPPPAHVAAA